MKNVKKQVILLTWIPSDPQQTQKQTILAGSEKSDLSLLILCAVTLHVEIDGPGSILYIGQW